MAQDFHISCTQQEVVPSNAVKMVKELFVPENRVAAEKAYAEELPGLDINKVNYIYSIVQKNP